MLMAPVGGEPATLWRLARELSDGAEECNRIRRRVDAARPMGGGEMLSSDLARLTRWFADSAADVRRRAVQLEADPHRRPWWLPNASPMAPWFSGGRCPDVLVTGQFVSGSSDRGPRTAATEHLRAGTACTSQRNVSSTLLAAGGLAVVPGILRITDDGGGGDGPSESPPPAAIPKGFSSRERFAEFGRRLHAALRRVGFADARAGLQGSSVTGFQWRTGTPFDAGRRSDLDVAIASPSAMRQAKARGIGLRSRGTRTGPLEPEELDALGLREAVDDLSHYAGREVHVMLFESIDDAAARAPITIVPGS